MSELVMFFFVALFLVATVTALVSIFTTVARAILTFFVMAAIVIALGHWAGVEGPDGQVLNWRHLGQLAVFVWDQFTGIFNYLRSMGS